MTDRDLMNGALTALKHQSHVYHGLTEHTANEALLREISSLLSEKQTMRLRVFEAMNRRGWYNPQLISTTQIEQHKQQMNQTFQKLQQELTHAQTSVQHQQHQQHPATVQGNFSYPAYPQMPQQAPPQPAWQGVHGPH